MQERAEEFIGILSFKIIRMQALSLLRLKSFFTHYTERTFELHVEKL